MTGLRKGWKVKGWFMLCEHLRVLDEELKGLGIVETFRGAAWSRNCREWVYYACYLDLAAIRKRLGLAGCVVDEANEDTKSGTERGFVCQEHWDAVMGRLEEGEGYPVVR